MAGWRTGLSVCTATRNVSSNCPVTYKVTHCQMIRKPNGNPPSNIFLFDFFEAFDFFFSCSEQMKQIKSYVVKSNAEI